MRLLKAERRLAGLGGRNLKGPPVTSQTHSVRMNFSPGSLSKFLVCHSCNCGFLDFWPTRGFLTRASLKRSTTAAMAKTPPSRSYRVFSLTDGLVSASASSTATNAAAEPAISASPATRFLLVRVIETPCTTTGSIAFVCAYMISSNERTQGAKHLRLAAFPWVRLLFWSALTTVRCVRVERVPRKFWRRLPSPMMKPSASPSSAVRFDRHARDECQQCPKDRLIIGCEKGVHQAEHAAQDVDAYGAPKFRKSTGLPVFTIRWTGSSKSMESYPNKYPDEADFSGPGNASENLG